MRGATPEAAGLGLMGTVATAAVLLRLGQGTLAGPPLDPAGAAAWLERDPLVAAVAGLRLVALGLCTYLVVVLVLGIVARRLRAIRLRSLADAVTLPALRRLLDASTAVSLVTVVAATSPTTAWASAPDDPPAMTADVVVRPPPIEWLLPGSDEVVRPPPLELLRSASPPAEPAPTPGTPRNDRPVTHVVAPGESFWSIATEVMMEASGRAATDAEVAGYWSDLIETNRHRLLDPGNPDLIHPGLQLRIPVPDGVLAADPGGVRDRGAP